jgi:hypothetical protein
MSIEERHLEESQPARKRGRTAGAQKFPKYPPRSVSEIWRAATEAERDTAKRQATELLSYWRGINASRQVARTLGIKQNHVYQLQQRALAGMVAALLPPSKRKSDGGKARKGGDELKALRKEVAKLKSERESLLGLVRLMRNLPGASSGRGKEGNGRKAKANANPDAKNDREMAHRGKSDSKGSGRAGEDPRSHGKNSEELAEA